MYLLFRPTVCKVRKIILLVLAVSACSSKADNVASTVDVYVPAPIATSFAPGDEGPAGGTIVWAARTPFPCGSSMKSWCNYLEASPQTAEIQLPWAETMWVTKEVAGANGSAIGTGWQNTMDIVAQGNSDPTKSAAAYAEAYEFGGMTDWFLPSRDELQTLITYREVVGGFTGELTWTSSERNALKSWQQHAQEGYQYVYDKSTIAYVRPLRAF